MGQRGKAHYPSRTPQPEAGPAYFEVDSNSTSDPDGLYDPAGIVSSVTHDGTAGDWTVTLKDAWYLVRAVANVEDDGDDAVNCHTFADLKSDSTQTQSSFKVTTLSSGSPANTNNITYGFHLYLATTE